MRIRKMPLNLADFFAAKSIAASAGISCTSPSISSDAKARMGLLLRPVSNGVRRG